jgi:hypothetical protein
VIGEPPIDEWSRAAALRVLAWSVSDDAACLSPADFARELLRRHRRLTDDQRRMVGEEGLRMLNEMRALDDGWEG